MMSLSLAKMKVKTPTKWIETTWIQTQKDPRIARVLSVIRYGGGCQFGDLVEVDPTGTPEEYQFLHIVEPAGYELHRVQGGAIAAGPAMALTERMREAGLHIEVWSLTMAGEKPPDPAPLDAGLVLPTSGIAWPQAIKGLQSEIAEIARSILEGFAREHAITLCAPSVWGLAGDELGAARQRKRLRQGPL